MNFISDAWAEGATGAAGPAGFASLVPLILIFVIFYFLLLRPQIKRAKEHKKMVGTLSKGDEVISNGGVLGRVTQVGEEFLSVEIAEGVEVKMQKNAISSLVPKGTMKSK